MSWLFSTQATEDPDPAIVSRPRSITSYSDRSSHSARRNSKKKVWCSSSGRWYRASCSVSSRPTSPTRTRSRPVRRVYSSAIARQLRHTSCTSGWFQACGLIGSPVSSSWSACSWSGSPSALCRPCATSIRSPSTPRSSQNRSTSSKCCRDVRMPPVEVRLLGRERVQVPLAVIDPLPGRAAENRSPVVRRLAPPDRRRSETGHAPDCPGRPPAPRGTTDVRRNSGSAQRPRSP